MVEEVVKGWSKRSIYCAQGASKPVPLVIYEMWHENISVLQIGDKDQMIIHNKVRNEVEADIWVYTKVVDEPSHY